MTEQYPWSDSGKQLLSIFEAKIQYYGGASVLIDELCREDIFPQKSYVRPKKKTKFQILNENHKAFVINNWHKMSTNDIAKKLKFCQSSIVRFSQQMNLGRNQYKKTYSTGQQYKLTDWYLNTETGIYYENLMRAVKSVNGDWYNMYFRIHKRKLNNTSFIRV